MTRTVEYYLAKGFEPRMAAYFASGRRKLVHVLPNEDHTLTLIFDNGEARRYDVKPLIEEGSVFAFLADPQNFKRVYLDDTHCVSWDIDPDLDSNAVWNNKVDLCPDTCYVDSVPDAVYGPFHSVEERMKALNDED